VKEDHKTYSEKAPPSEDEIFKVVHDGIDFKKHSNITIDCSDKSIVPITQFTDASGLHPKVLKNISRAKYTDPTPVQRYAIPIGLAGRDLMACAQTGSGKTAAFLVPGLTRLLELKPPERNRRYSEPYALILAPTRELAVQIQKEVLKFSYETWIRSSVLYGGAPIGGQARDLERGVDVVVGTPGRVKDFIKRGKLFFNETRFLCLDEADRMLDMGFEKDIRAIIKGVNPSRHTVMFSATFPREIRELATDFLRNHVFLSVGRVGAAVDTITQVIKEVSELDKRTEILKDAKAHPGRTLIFAEKKVDADRLARHLFANGVACTAIHGSRTQNEREAALAAFKAGRLHILVATDVASRGLDVPDIVHVINYDLPATIDSYIHRVGRTGRAGNKGLATSYYNHEQNAALAKDLVKTLKEAKQEIPEYLLDGCAWGILEGSSCRETNLITLPLLTVLGDQYIHF